MTFTTNPGSAHNTLITFGDSPATRDVNDVDGNSVPTNYIAGSVIFAQGIEGDVAGRINGNGALTSNDVTILRQFVNGSITADNTVNEFQRADVAPSGGKGNGLLTSADVTVLRSYLAQSTFVPVGGPSQLNPPALWGESSVGDVVLNEKLLAAHDIRVVNVNGVRGENVDVIIELDSGGNENGVTASIQFDSSKLTYVSSAAGADVASQSGTTFDSNLTQIASGRLGLSTTLNIGVAFTPGPKQVFKITFHISSTAPAGPTAISFVNQPLPMEINDPSGNEIPLNQIPGGQVNIQIPTAAGASVSGSVIGPNRRGISGATVSITDGDEVTRSVRTNTLGSFVIGDLPTGRTYFLTVRDKRYEFEMRTFSLTDSISGVTFVPIK